MKLILGFAFVLVCLCFYSQTTVAQQGDPFQAPEFIKVELVDAETFQRRFRNVQWTGQGFQQATAMDQIPAIELRARFQTVFGNPTKRLEDLITKPGFRLAEAIQYEYWFIINDLIPIMVLDVDGPFAPGMVYAGPVTQIDYLPGLKRALSAKLMEVNNFEEFHDLYYAVERNKWFDVKYKDGEFIREEISRPAQYRNINLN